MKKALFSFLFLLITFSVFSQESQKAQNTIYIIDNVPVIKDPDENSGTLGNDEIEEVTVVTDKDKIKLTGYEVDKIIYITTKEYKKRPEEVKVIPTTKTMTRKDGAWFLKDTTIPYSGKFIDYFLNGKIQGEGILKNGIVDGSSNMALFKSNTALSGRAFSINRPSLLVCVIILVPFIFTITPGIGSPLSFDRTTPVILLPIPLFTEISATSALFEYPLLFAASFADTVWELWVIADFFLTAVTNYYSFI